MKKSSFLKKGGFVLPAILVAGFFVFHFVFAYDPHNAHRALTYEIGEFYNSSFGNKLAQDDIDYLMQGAEDEDTPPRWINHFYNPATGEGWVADKLGSVPKEILMVFSQFALSSRSPISSKNWAKNRLAQTDYDLYGGDQTWQRAIELYASDDRQGGLTALGHTLHLIEDITVPDHTRNDTHLEGVAGDKGSALEIYAKEQAIGKIKNLKIAENLYQSGIKPLNLPILEDYFDATAKYSHDNFFSNDTIIDKIKPEILYKQNIDTDTFIFVKNGIDIYPVAKYPIDKDSIDSYTISDPRIMSAYWSRLSKQAVVSGAGVINLFFQEVEKYKKLHPNPAPRQIISNSKIFSPYGEFVKIGKAINNFVLGAKTIAADILPSAETTVDINNLQETPKSAPAKSLTAVKDSANKKTEKQQNIPASTHTITEAAATVIAQQETKENLYVSRVVDGDTVILSNGKDVRLIGMNTPEIGQKCADEATQEIKNLVLGKYVTLGKDTSETDKYGRLLRFIYLDGVFVNAEMVRDGLARVMTVPPDIKYASTFKTLEAEARSSHRGCLWKNDRPVGGAPETDLTLDLGPYYGGSSYANSPEQPTQNNQDTDAGTPAPYNNTTGTPQNAATSTPDDPPPIIIIPTSTPEAATSTPIITATSTLSNTTTSTPETATSTPSEPVLQTKILINEIQITGVTARDEFIELYNPNDTPADITEWKITKKTKSGNESNLVSKFSASTTIPAHSYFLIVPQPDGTTTGTPADATYTGASYSVAADNTVLIKNQNGEIVDKIGMGLATDYETAPAPNPPKSQSLARQNFQDTDNNFNDFVISSSTPQGTSSTPLKVESPPPLPPEPIITCTTSTYETHDNNKGAVISGVKRLPEIYANVDTVLQANTTYYIDYQIYVKPKARLIIPEGVIIKFGWWRIDGNYYFPAMLRVAGSLEINGTKNNPVIFTSFRDDAHGAPLNATTSTPAPGDWGALQIESDNTETVKIQNAKFYYGGGHQDMANSFGGAIFLNLSDAGIDISNTEIAQSNSGIYSRAKSTSQPEILNSNFENNKLWGVALEKGSAIKIVGNTIKCNGLLRGASTGGGAYIKGGSPNITIENNNFLANETAGLNYVPDKNESLTATNNFWGHSSGPFHAIANPAGLGNAVSDNIIFSPWSLSSNSY